MIITDGLCEAVCQQRPPFDISTLANSRGMLTREDGMAVLAGPACRVLLHLSQKAVNRAVVTL